MDGVPDDYPGYTCLDFKHKEVRDERFALIAETLKKYPVDGFELQMNLPALLFPPGRGRCRARDYDRVGAQSVSRGQTERQATRVGHPHPL